MLACPICGAEIDFDREWDDPENSGPVKKKIDAYLNPGLQVTHDARGYPLIHYAGNVHVLGRVPALQFNDITDGTANTILVGEIKERLRAWGDPRNLRDPGLGLNRGPATFGADRKDGFVQFVGVDGAVHRIDVSTPPHVLQALGTPDGGEAVSFPE